MNSNWHQKWNLRYHQTPNYYGTSPNVFFKQCLKKFKIKGTILLPAEGEGRNAIYAAHQGLKVEAFDISEAAQKQALQLAHQNKLKINYQVGDFLKMEFPKKHFDAIALIYAHFPSKIRNQYHQKLLQLLKPNGLIFLEGFSLNNLELRKRNPQIGGPQDPEMLFTIQQLQKDFSNLKHLKITEKTIQLKEGIGHNGLAKIIRLTGQTSLAT